LSNLKKFVADVEAVEHLESESIEVGKDGAVAAKNVVKQRLKATEKGLEAIASKRVLSDDPKKVAHREKMREWRESKRGENGQQKP
jgi:hypothetical protein